MYNIYIYIAIYIYMLFICLFKTKNNIFALWSPSKFFPYYLQIQLYRMCSHCAFIHAALSDWEYFNQTLIQTNKISQSLTQAQLHFFTQNVKCYDLFSHRSILILYHRIITLHCTSWLTCWSPQPYSFIKLRNQRL